MNNPIKTYQYLSWFIHEEDGTCYDEVKHTICHGSFFFFTRDQQKRSWARIDLMLERITQALREAEINPRTLFPKDDKDWRWDGKNKRLAHRRRTSERFWPNTKSLLKRIQDTWDE